LVFPFGNLRQKKETVSLFLGMAVTISPSQFYVNHFPVLAHITHDILAILGVSIFMECLFSSVAVVKADVFQKK
jgi:hypothetical protein